MEKIILFGASEGSKLMYHSLLHDSSFEVIAFTVDSKYLNEKEYCGLPVVPFEQVQDIYPPNEYGMLITVLANEMNMLRARKYHEAKEKGYTLISYIHPTSIVACDMITGDNCFISEGVIVRPNVKVGNDTIIMPGVYIGHDTVIEEHSFVASRAVIMGAVTLKSFTVIGPNATIMEQLTIGSECLIGGGAVILKSTNEKEVYRANQATLMPLTSDKISRFIYGKKR
jgi:sugar O-acyltransferase (sialic acid O-acetyltransferase NeuD family)